VPGAASQEEEEEEELAPRSDPQEASVAAEQKVAAELDSTAEPTALGQELEKDTSESEPKPAVQPEEAASRSKPTTVPHLVRAPKESAKSVPRGEDEDDDDSSSSSSSSDSESDSGDSSGSDVQAKPVVVARSEPKPVVVAVEPRPDPRFKLYDVSSFSEMGERLLIHATDEPLPAPVDSNLSVAAPIAYQLPKVKWHDVTVDVAGVVSVAVSRLERPFQFGPEFREYSESLAVLPKLTTTRPRCRFLDELKTATGPRLWVLGCYLFMNGFNEPPQFVPAFGRLNVHSEFGGLWPDFLKSINCSLPYQSQVSLFVSGAISRGWLTKLLGLISRDTNWQSANYSVGSLMAHPGLIDEVTPYFVEVPPLTQKADLLSACKRDEQLRFILKVAFEYLELREITSLATIVKHLENGMIYDDMPETKGPWRLIADCVQSKKVNKSMVDAFQKAEKSTRFSRKWGTKLEEFLYQGLLSEELADWIIQINACTQEVEALYVADATIADPARALVLADSIRRFEIPLKQ
jgi:hypothetical protein